MKDFLSNVWVKRAVSVFNVAYFAVITLLTYATFLYDLEFAAGREKSFFTVYVVINVVFMGLMLFSRRELVTEILSILMLPKCPERKRRTLKLFQIQLMLHQPAVL